MRSSLRRCYPFVLLFLSSCEKSTVSVDAQKGASPEASRSPNAADAAAGSTFAKECEGWKARAVQEFPDLGKAGTAMNSRFVERAKQLSGQKSEELKYPNWPYLLAVKINAELAMASKGKVNAGTPGITAGVDGVGRVYSVQELKALSVLPGAAVVMGRVTKFDETGLPLGVLMVVLDDALKCELTLFEVVPGDNLAWQRSGSSISLVRQTGRGGSAPTISISTGQALRVEGAFVQRRGAPGFGRDGEVPVGGGSTL
jgi:hypothetical protein